MLLGTSDPVEPPAEYRPGGFTARPGLLSATLPGRTTPIDDLATLFRVASVPAGHPYVANLGTGWGSGTVRRLADPLPTGAPAGRWWPPVMLTEEWVAARRDDFDVMHIHFGVESLSADELTRVLAALRRAERPLVYTVHDLTNPQLEDQSRHLEHLDLLVEGADELLTLTDAAATAIEERWGRRPVVARHPHLWPLDRVAPTGAPAGPLLLGTHLRDLRPNIDGPGTVVALIEAVEELRSAGFDAEAVVHLRDRARDEAEAGRVVELVDAAPRGAVRLVRGDRHTDEALADSLAELDVAVLPYRTGTHSGWAELCFDLGVPVAGRSVGFIEDQHPENFAAFSPGRGVSLARAVLELSSRLASRSGSTARAELVESRRAERATTAEENARIHLETYRRALAGRVAA